jgi:hypothetical protein
MSYCRWSSDDFMCDLYCYQSDVAYVTHVAQRRPYIRPFPAPRLTLLDKRFGFIRWRMQNWLHGLTLSLIPRRTLTLPHAGESFYDGDITAFYWRLVHLRSLGYQFPSYVLAAVTEEMADETQGS